MPRQARVVIPDCPHHITQRGNYRQAIFDDPADYDYYCELIELYRDKYSVKISCYCLMSNHIHFIVTPPSCDSLSKLFNTVHMRYAQYINKKRNVLGHLWQGRFFSCILDPAHLYNAMRYVEQNPVRAGMVDKAWDYPYSSAKDHTGCGQSDIAIEPVDDQDTSISWKKYLSQMDTQFCDDIRLKTHRGLIVGRPSFIQHIEDQMKRSFASRNPGRPRKE